MSRVSNVPDEQLNKVTGGYVEDDIGYDTFGKNIICPYCNSSDRLVLERKTSDDILNPGNYYCNNCKKFFMINP